MVRAGVIKLNIFVPGLGDAQKRSMRVLIFHLKASRVPPKTDRGITG